MPQPRELLEEIQAKESLSSFGEDGRPMTEFWCEGSAMTFGKQASAAYRRHIGSPVQRNRLVKTIGERAKLPFGVHAHMLRHACGYALANAGHDTRLIQDWLGHRAIQHTARYTELSPTRFKEVWH